MKTHIVNHSFIKGETTAEASFKYEFGFFFDKPDLSNIGSFLFLVFSACILRFYLSLENGLKIYWLRYCKISSPHLRLRAG